MEEEFIRFRANRLVNRVRHFATIFSDLAITFPEVVDMYTKNEYEVSAPYSNPLRVENAFVRMGSATSRAPFFATLGQFKASKKI